MDSICKPLMFYPFDKTHHTLFLLILTKTHLAKGASLLNTTCRSRKHSTFSNRFARMLIELWFVRLGGAWRMFDACRLIQFQTNSTNRTQFGSTKVSIDHRIADISNAPNSRHVVVTQISNVDIHRIEAHINASSPILFILPKRPTDTSKLEQFLLNRAHDVPIYFTKDLTGFPFGFEKLKTMKTKPNSLKRNTVLQNIIGVMNSSKSTTRQRIMLITVPFDTFSPAPTLEVGYNSSGIAIAAFLEVMKLVARYPIINDWSLMFAVADGRFCGFEGLTRLLNSFSPVLKSKIEFAISLDSIYTKTLHIHLNHQVRSDSTLYRFIKNLEESLTLVGIRAEICTTNPFTQEVFKSSSIESVSITGGNVMTSVTDCSPDYLRADSFAWALGESILRTIYETKSPTVLLDQKLIDTSVWTRIIGSVPRVAPFRDQTFASVILQWMQRFSNAYIDEWTSNTCFAPFTATDAVMLLYSSAPFYVYLLLYAGGIVYGIVVFMALARQKVFAMHSCL